MAGAPTNLLSRVRATLDQFHMLTPGESVLAAVSGGADSVCLLDVLVELGYAVEVAHFDHQTRGIESAEDSAFVETLARRYGVPMHCERRPIREEAEASPMSFEEYARGARYAFLLAVAQAQGCTAIATGHHADDQAETVLMRIVRGVSPSGLTGIPPVRMLDNVRVVRPLLGCSRDSIMSYLDQRDLPYRTDSSNTQTEYVRNRVRQELLPALERGYNPQVREALTRLADLQRAENEYVAEQARQFLASCYTNGQITRRAFSEAAVALQRRALAELAWQREVDCEFDRVESARLFIVDAPAGSSFDLGGGILLRNARDVTEIVGSVEPSDSRAVRLACPGETVAFGRRFVVSEREQAPPLPLREYCNQSRQVFDADAVGSELWVRLRRPGDRIVPLGMAGTRKLKDYFGDLGLPIGERDRLPLIVTEDTIVWIVGHAVSANAAVTAHTKRYIEIEVQDET
ncbi:MAG: tRNA lysidine(34) synthetase TilS [Candidatus Hydrogenedentes bacterium]|nr:tRNA lysidine(34) synthetase TilS [Candidatus Hydrogenedentota bacterium]